MEQGSVASEGVPTTDAAVSATATAPSSPAVRRRRPRRALAIVGALLGAAFLWEAAKWVAGDPWRLTGLRTL